ncbi:GNAT family N-acetyltransferase [Roseovarius sp. MMSF_3281]|uniref:GNAT family N-acetyltransferase n=1 Tax=Roseovarius sp. MMSF_3281 TaxID=3046694 RepID=UPI00273EB647|nr:GNAT family N-acetyltransferase [Roseovarius sp. MMSF_3281]
MIHIRQAGAMDARQMAELLNAIIRKGGTTALTHEVTREAIAKRIEQAPANALWHLAEDEAGHLLGFQYANPHPDLPPEACDIATFVKLGTTGLGIGSKLFETTKAAARALGYRWINATIRADNAGGLAYYQSRGFEDYARQPNQALADGQVVDKISKRFDL